MRICDAKFGNLLLYDGDATFGWRRMHNVPPAYRRAAASASRFIPGQSALLGRMVRTKSVVQIADLTS